MAPARIVADVRAAMGREDIVLADTGAVKMWMARLYPTYHPDTCLISNGLATMAFSLPGAIAAKMAFPERKVLAAFKQVRTLPVDRFLVDGDRVVIHWVFEFMGHDGQTFRQDELAWQRWRGDRIVEERFYYDPAQQQPASR